MIIIDILICLILLTAAVGVIFVPKRLPQSWLAQ
jgi:hypothetical protein